MKRQSLVKSYGKIDFLLVVYYIDLALQLFQVLFCFLTVIDFNFTTVTTTVNLFLHILYMMSGPTALSSRLRRKSVIYLGLDLPRVRPAVVFAVGVSFPSAVLLACL